MDVQKYIIFSSILDLIWDVFSMKKCLQNLCVFMFNLTGCPTWQLSKNLQKPVVLEGFS